MTLHFVIDAQLPTTLAQHLVGLGHRAEHVSRLSLRASSDADIWTYVMRQGAVLFSKDADFIELAERSPRGPALVWVKLGNTRNHVLFDSISRAMPSILEAVANGERVIVVE